MTRIILSALLIAVLMGGCSLFRGSSGSPGDGPPQVGIDPTFTWDAPTLNCDGSPLTNLAGFNLYVHQPPTTPIPTTPNVDSVPCGTRNIPTQAPNNPALITATTYFIALPEGQYSVYIETMNDTGGSSGVEETEKAVFEVKLFPDFAPGSTIQISGLDCYAIKSGMMAVSWGPECGQADLSSLFDDKEILLVQHP